MKTGLLYPEHDSDWHPVSDMAARQQEARRHGRAELPAGDGLPWNAATLTVDLGLATLVAAAADGNDILAAALQHALLTGTGNELATIRYRQAMLQDAMAHAAAVRALHALAGEIVAEGRQQDLDPLLLPYPDSVLRWAIEALRLASGWIRRLQALTGREGTDWKAPGWQAFFARIRRDFDEETLQELTAGLDGLRFPNGMVLSATPGPGLHSAGFRLHPPLAAPQGWLRRLLHRWLPSSRDAGAEGYGFSVSPGDEAANRALEKFRNHGVAIAARTLAGAATRIRDFFATLQVETAFYVAALNLHDRLQAIGLPRSFPLLTGGAPGLRFTGLCAPVLALSQQKTVVGNSVNADGMTLVVITGANQGGKSTLLRAIGVAQLMAQCGLFVTADSYAASLVPAVVTHYPRAEDSSLAHGKFDEELARMDAIVTRFRPGMLLLLNESFASTSEREASAIAADVVEALRTAGARVLFVTHLHEYAQAEYMQAAAARTGTKTLFLRAVRAADGSRPFHIVPGAPLHTSFGEDLYRRIFADLPLP